MLKLRMICFLLALACAFPVMRHASAAEVDSDAVYCFTPEDFPEKVTGICVMSVPEKNLGTVMLGSRTIRPGDILTAEQMARLTFCPVRTEEDAAASVTYLPIYSDHVAASATVTVAIRGKEDRAPAAEDFAVETYKNLPIEGKLKAKDPEGGEMTYTVTRQPRRGTVTVAGDGTFTYTPKKNKVGIDTFVYTATDPAGKVSREATVTVTVLKPTDAAQYTDTLGKSCRFAAEWMKNTGIFVAEQVAENSCFSPDKPVTRGEFVTMLVRALEIPTEEALACPGMEQEVPGWLKPYLAAAMRSGLTAGLPQRDSFGYDAPITGAEAAVMVQNALDLTARTGETEQDTLPAWAADALNTLSGYGIELSPEASLTRGDAAVLLYRTVQLSDTAPGMDILRMQQ